MFSLFTIGGDTKKARPEMDGPKTPFDLWALEDHPDKHATPRPVRPW